MATGFDPSAEYDRDQTGVWHPKNRRHEFGYSDGDASEEQLLAIVRRAQDRSTGSESLLAEISDWPTRYHLSGVRANLLRPLAPWLSTRHVLEVGSGMGAITRYLGETARSVVSVEGSARRASIGATRCSDLENVTVVCDNFANFGKVRFDVVTLIGVLEYSRQFVDAPDPIRAMLQRCADATTDDGAVVIAIENQLGLKYFAGALEDHVPRPFFGINDLYGAKTPVTFGLRELRRLLADVGLTHVEAFATLPDYKLPAFVAHEAAFDDPRLRLGDILQSVPAYTQALPYDRTFSEELNWPVICRNGLAMDVANSFLLVASKRPAAVVAPDGPLAWVYSAERKRPFAKSKSFSAGPDGIAVSVDRLYPGTVQPQDGVVRQMAPGQEPYLEGEPLISGFYRVVNREGWTMKGVSKWAAPWIQWLGNAAGTGPLETRVLPGDYLDAIPRNFIVTASGDLAAFDLEWVAAGTLPLPYVVFRGLLSVFAQTASVEPPDASLQSFVGRYGIPHGRLADLAGLAATACGVPTDGRMVNDYLERERLFQEHVRVAPKVVEAQREWNAVGVRRGSLQTAGVGDLARALGGRVTGKLRSVLRRS